MHGAPLAEPASLCFLCHDGKVLVRMHGGHASLPRLADLQSLGVEPDDAFQFGTLGHAACFVSAQTLDGLEQGGWQAVGLRALHALVDDQLFLVAGRALQYAEWDRNHRHCGRCGSATERANGLWARRCLACNYASFPRIAPAVIVLVHKGDACLLAHAAHHPEGMHSVLAGFLEPGETLEECVAREIREEVGIEVTDIQYFGNQPWPFPHSLMLGFTAAWKSGELTPDGEEILRAGWYTRDALPERIPSRISIARELIDHFFAGR